MAIANPPPEFDIHRVLAQTNPSGTSAITAYTKPTNKLVTVESIIVCNTTGSTCQYSVYLCTNGTTYDATTAIVFATNIVANETQSVDIGATLDTTSGTIGIKSSSANALNFTLLGKIKEYS